MRDGLQSPKGSPWTAKPQETASVAVTPPIGRTVRRNSSSIFIPIFILSLALPIIFFVGPFAAVTVPPGHNLALHTQRYRLAFGNDREDTPT